jgi:hypothetical protein
MTPAYARLEACKKLPLSAMYAHAIKQGTIFFHFRITGDE